MLPKRMRYQLHHTSDFVYKDIISAQKGKVKVNIMDSLIFSTVESGLFKTAREDFTRTVRRIGKYGFTAYNCRKGSSRHQSLPDVHR